MKFAFAIFKYFPYGGLQRDMLRMAEAAAARGHNVVIFTSEWEGAQPSMKDRISIEFIKLKSRTNHGRANEFEKKFLQKIENDHFDVKVAFNRIAGGDLYFAADNCLASELPKKHSQLTLRLHPRYRTFLRQEKTICDSASNTRIMYITPRQKTDYIACYNTPEERFAYLPPGMNYACRRPENAEWLRMEKRAELGLSDDEIMLILVGSDFHRKGGDRAVTALASLPAEWKGKTYLFLVGAASTSKCEALAERLDIYDHVRLLGGRKDVPELLLAADLMVHPARDEATGTVLVEGIAAGVPVLCSGECGFSNFVRDAAGLVLPEPFSQDHLNSMLLESLERLTELSERTRDYAVTADFYRRDEVAVNLMEEAASSNRG